MFGTAGLRMTSISKLRNKNPILYKCIYGTNTLDMHNVRCVMTTCCPSITASDRVCNLTYSKLKVYCLRLKKNVVLQDLCKGYCSGHSALYVGNYDLNMTPTVDIDLGLQERFADIKELDKNLKVRKIDLNIYMLMSKYKALKELGNEKNILEQEKLDIASVMSVLVKEAKTPEIEHEKKILIARGKKIREQLKSVNKLYFDLEKQVMLTALRLPSDFHHSTRPEDVVIQEFGCRKDFNFKLRSHVSIGKKTNTLLFSPVSPGACYLQGTLANLERDFLGYMSWKLRSHGFTQFSCPDFVKSCVVESCGVDFDNPQEVFTLEPKLADQEGYNKNTKTDAEEMNKWDITMHLVGASPMSFAAYLTRMITPESWLPLKYFSTGRYYTPEPTDALAKSGLLQVQQKSRIELFGGTTDPQQCEELYEGYVKYLCDIYREFDFLPLRVVRVGVSGLQQQESGRTEVQVWIPTLDTYVKVAYVSMWDDFLGRRLMMTYARDDDNDAHRNFIHTVHGTALCVPTLLAAIMENHQTKNGHYQIPAELDSLLKMWRTR